MTAKPTSTLTPRPSPAKCAPRTSGPTSREAPASARRASSDLLMITNPACNVRATKIQTRSRPLAFRAVVAPAQSHKASASAPPAKSLSKAGRRPRWSARHAQSESTPARAGIARYAHTTTKRSPKTRQTAEIMNASVSRTMLPPGMAASLRNKNCCLLTRSEAAT